MQLGGRFTQQWQQRLFVKVVLLPAKLAVHANVTCLFRQQTVQIIAA